MFDKIISLVLTVTTAVSGAATSAVNSVENIYQRVVNSAPVESTFDQMVESVTPQMVTTFVDSLSSLNVDFAVLAQRRTLIDAQFDLVNQKLKNLDTIIGNPATKHGEIAELLEVAIHNAKRIAQGLQPNAVSEPNRTHETIDYWIDGKTFQAKFHKTPLSTIYAAANEVGPEFDFVTVPRDQFEVFEQIRKSKDLTAETIEFNGSALPLSTKNAINRHLEKLDNNGVKLHQSQFTHAEVQPGMAARQTAKTTQIAARMQALNPKQLGVGAAWSGGVGAAISAGFSIYDKVSAGKSIENFTTQDWQEIGLYATADGTRFAAVSVGAGVASAALKIPMPIAAGIVASLIQISTLAISYHNGNLTLQELLAYSLEFSIASLLVGAGAAIGAAALTTIGLPKVIATLVATVAAGVVVSAVPVQVATARIAEITEAFVYDFTERFNELAGATTARIGNGAQVTKATLRNAYTRAKDSVVDATAYAAARVATVRPQ